MGLVRGEGLRAARLRVEAAALVDLHADAELGLGLQERRGLLAGGGHPHRTDPAVAGADHIDDPGARAKAAVGEEIALDDDVRAGREGGAELDAAHRIARAAEANRRPLRLLASVTGTRPGVVFFREEADIAASRREQHRREAEHDARREEGGA